MPLVGAPGNLLEMACRTAGVPRRQLAVLKAAACGPVPAGADALKQRALAACRPRLLAELQALRPRAILAIGGHALKSVAPMVPSGITAVRGALLPRPSDIGASDWDPLVTASFHPAHILRGSDNESDDPRENNGPSVDLLYYFLVYDLHKAWRLGGGSLQPWQDECDLFLVEGEAAQAPLPQLKRATIDESDKPVEGELATKAEFISAMLRIEREAIANGEFACDVETDAKDSLEAGLTAIAVATKQGSLSATWLAFQKTPEARWVLQRMLANPALRKWFHNRIYDCVVLPRHGLPVAAPVHDTLLLHHATFPGLPHKLDQVAQQLLPVHAWKDEFRKSARHIPELVLYNSRDAQATALIPEPLMSVLKARRTERVYAADRQIVGVAQAMRQFGFWVDRQEQARQSAVQHARLDFMRASLEKDFAAIADVWLDRLARNMAMTQRKHDSDDFMQRVEQRKKEIRRRELLPTSVGLFKTKAKNDLVALFEVLRIPITQYTPTGKPVTDKKAMEAAAAKHPLMRQLIHIREAQHLLATYIDGLPVKPLTGRVHPDWSITKISGRWGAGKAQNIPKLVSGWPPELDDQGKYKRKPSGDYVTPPENCRAIITAPTVEEILRFSAACPQVMHDPRYAPLVRRAQEGHGRLLVGADMNQLELRIAALLGRDPFLLDAYSRNADVHAMNAAVCFPRVFPKLEADWRTLLLGTKYGSLPKPIGLKADLSALDLLDDATREKLRKLQKPWSKLRDLAKRLVYAWIYRGRPETAYESLVREFPEVELLAVKEAFRLLDQRIVGWVAWCQRNEAVVRRDREIREALLGRVRLVPLGNYDPNVAVNFPVQAFGATLITKAFLRFCALTAPHLLDLGELYEHDLLDPGWVAQQQRDGFAEWVAPPQPIINGHDAITVECDEVDALSTCPRCGTQAHGNKCRACAVPLPPGRMSVFLERCMEFNITLGGATMRFFGEAAVGRRLSET